MKMVWNALRMNYGYDSVLQPKLVGGHRRGNGTLQYFPVLHNRDGQSLLATLSPPYKGNEGSALTSYAYA